MKKWIYRAVLLTNGILMLLATIESYLRISNQTAGNQIFLSLSWGIIGFLAIITISLVILSCRHWSRPGDLFLFDRVLKSQRWFWGVLLFLILIEYEAGQNLLFIAANLNKNYYPALLLQNRSLLVWASIISGINILAWVYLGFNSGTLKKPRIKSVPVWLIAGVIFWLIIINIRGKVSLPTNTPVPMLHVIVGSLIVLIGLIGYRWIRKRSARLSEFLSRDLIAFIVMVTISIVVWVSVPLQANGFIETLRPPNYEFAPKSDAIFYEIQSQRFLAGEGFDENVQHSLYNYFAALLHQLGGDSFEDIYRLQIFVLALIPFFIYKMSSLISNRLTGWLTGILFIFREYNALQLGDNITVANVQVLMTEPLALFGVVLFLYLTISWLQDKDQSPAKPFLIGSIVGLIVLVRVELISLLAVFVAAVLLVYIRSWKRWILPSLFLILAFSMTVSPWIIRNYRLTGQFTIDKSTVFTRIINNYFVSTNAEPDIVGPSPEIPMGDRIEQILAKTGKVLNRFNSSIQQAVVYLPSNHFPLGGADNFVNIVPEKSRIYLFQEGVFSDAYLRKYIKSLPYWSHSWQGEISEYSLLPVLITSIFFANGVWFAWKRQRWIGLLPLLTMAAHMMSYAVYFKSGGRHIQVVDWISLFYYSYGFINSAGIIINRFSDNPEIDFGSPVVDRAKSDPGIAWPWEWVVGSIFIIVALSMPVLEAAIPQRYSQSALDELLQSSDPEIIDQVVDLSGLEKVYYGKVLYPNYYLASEIFDDDRSGKMPDTGVNQLVFYLIGSDNIWVSMPIDDPEIALPHGSEILLKGRLVRNSAEDREKKTHPYLIGDSFIILR